MKIFRKFRENDRRCCEIFGFEFCYGKIPYQNKVMQQIQILQQSLTALKTDQIQQIQVLQQSLTALKTDQLKMITGINYIQKIFPIYLNAFAEHQKVFPKYKNCHKEKKLVLLASGPTLDDYEPQSDVLFMGVNRSFLSGKADLDYLFVQDLISDIQDQIDEYQGNSCKKFYGMHYLVPGIAESHADKAHAERYYFVDINMLSPWPFPIDCSVMPFNTYSSVVFPAAVFALWTGVKELYLVGCDTNLNGYFGGVDKNTLCLDNVIYGWKKFKEFAEIWYPETEIISVNPVGLRGLFHDVYTESYLDKHPEVAETKPEILRRQDNLNMCNDKIRMSR